MKKAYQTHPVTHEYLGEVEVSESPLEPGVYLVPAAAYVEAPPSSKDGYAIVRQGDKWEYIEDNKAAEQEEPELTNPPLTSEQIAAQVRADRDAKIESVRWRIERARDELELGVPLTEPLEPLLQHVQALRDVPQQAGFPENVEWPVEP